MTEFGDALAKAINKSKTDINNLVWKEANGKEVRLMDMDEKQLKKAGILGKGYGKNRRG